VVRTRSLAETFGPAGGGTAVAPPDSGSHVSCAGCPDGSSGSPRRQPIQRRQWKAVGTADRRPWIELAASKASDVSDDATVAVCGMGSTSGITIRKPVLREIRFGRVDSGMTSAVEASVYLSMTSGTVGFDDPPWPDRGTAVRLPSRTRSGNEPEPFRSLSTSTLRHDKSESARTKLSSVAGA